jgi:hypothetical protein
MSDEKVAAAKAEVQRLLDVGFILPKLARKCSNGQEKESQVENVHRLH